MAKSQLGAALLGAQPPPSAAPTWRLIRDVLVACLASLHFGLALGFTSPCLKPIREELLGDSAPRAALVGSIVNVGALLGALLLGGVLAERCGRRAALALSAVPSVAGWALIAFALDSEPYGFVMLLAGRLLSGVAVGIGSFATPLYVNEIAPAALRGGLGTINQLMIVSGILLAYIAGAALVAGPELLGWQGWRWAAAASAAPLTLLAMCASCIDESPRWLAKRQRLEEAEAALRNLRGQKADIAEEMAEITAASLSAAAGGGSGGFGMLCDQSLRPQLTAAIGLQVLCQLSGINSVTFFAGDILAAAGFPDANFNAILLQLVQLGVTGISALLVDRLGRKPLYATAAGTCCIS